MRNYLDERRTEIRPRLAGGKGNVLPVKTRCENDANEFHVFMKWFLPLFAKISGERVAVRNDGNPCADNTIGGYFRLHFESKK